MGAIKRRTVRIGTRKSRLALVQTNMVAEAIEAVCPEVKCELVPLMTKGDKILKTSLVAFGGKGAFVEEFEQSILNGDIDLAVHSAKDMPMDLSDGLCIGAVLKREDPRDVFVTVKGRTPESQDHRNGKSETSGADHGARGCGMPPAPRKRRHETGKTVPEGVRRDHPGCGGTIEAGTF